VPAQSDLLLTETKLWLYDRPILQSLHYTYMLHKESYAEKSCTKNQSKQDAINIPWSIPCLRQSSYTDYWWHHPAVCTETDNIHVNVTLYRDNTAFAFISGCPVSDAASAWPNLQSILNANEGYKNLS